MENFVLYDEIGAGNERTVYKGRRKGTIEYVSIHCIGKSKRKQIQNNVRICHELDHRNIVRFHEWYETSNHLWLVVELCTGASLQNILLQDIFLPESTIKTFGKDLLCGLAYLHSTNIVYADLCPKKILLDGDGTLKYSNFSLAKFDGENDYSETFVGNLSSGRMSIVGSPLYMAPEVLNGEGASKESDLWQLGCTIYEMFMGYPPFKADSFENLCAKIIEAKIPYPIQDPNDTSSKASENLFMLIQGLLQPDPSKRMDWLELSLHPFWDGELAHLADSFSGHILTERSIISDSFNYTGHELSATEKSDGVNESNMHTTIGMKKRPDTVPQQNSSKALHTASLNELDERPPVTTLVTDAQTNVKEHWQGTYKLEHGLAIMDLTEIGEVDEQAVDEDRIVYSKSRESKSPHCQKSEHVNNGSINSASAAGLSEIIWDFNDLNLNINDHLYHSSDLQVNPIAENPKLLKLHVLKWDPSLLGFHALNIEKLRNGTKEEAKTHVATVFNAYGQVQKGNQDKSGTRQKLHILAYLSNIAKHEEVSNTILEQNHMKYFNNEFKVSGQFDVKIRLGRVIGVIASNTTYIPLTFNMTELFTVLTDQLKQNFRNTLLKHSLLPAIGEFLFFAATQEENENMEIQQWEPSAAVFTIITRCLQQEDDYITRHIAAKIIENVTVTHGRYCKKFLTNDIGLGLWNLFIHAASDLEKITAASGLCRISMHASTILQHVSDRAGFNTFQQCVVSGTQKSQQSFVTIFVTLLSSNNHAKRILQETNLIKKLMHNLESASFILRGKIYLLLAEMCTRSHDVLLQCCDLRIITYLEKDGRRLLIGGKDNKEMLEYLHQCLAILVKRIITLLPPIFDSVLHILDMVTGRHHPNPAQTKQLKLHLPLLSIAVHLVTSSLFRRHIVNPKFIQYVGKLLMQIRKIDSGEINLSGNAALSEQATSNIFSIVEAMTQIPPILLENFFNIVADVLPVLASFSNSDDGNLRILSMKLFVDISTLFMDNEVDDSKLQNYEKDSEALFLVIEKYFLPDFEILLQDHEPLPSYCLKLLYSCTEKFPKIIEVLVSRDILSNLITMIQLNLGDISNTVLQSTVGILNNMVSYKQIDFMSLYKPILIEYLTSTFIEVVASIDEDVNTNNLSSILLQLLDTLHHVLKNIEVFVKNVLGNKNQAGDENFKQHVESMLQESQVLSELNGILMNLLIFDDNDIREWTCRCLLLSAELFGGKYEDCFNDENIECLCQALRDSPCKRQKVLLRIIRRFISSNANLEEIFRTSDTTFKATLEKLLNANSVDSDGKNVRNLSQELLKLLHF